jgi:small subunit ribosomal protein S2
MSEDEDLLVERELYLENGVHIGTQSQNADMEDYIFHVKKNGLAILDLDTTDKRIRSVANTLRKYPEDEIVVVGRKDEAYQPIKTFSEEIGTKTINGRFMPGTFTNPQSDNFMEPEIVVVTDPEEDKQAVKEASDVDIPVIAIADSGDSLENIDMVIAANNKGEKALGTVLYLLADQIKGESEPLGANMEDFISQPIQVDEEEAAEA